MWPFSKPERQPSTGRDPFERLSRRVALLEGEVERLETAWQGTKDELRRSYQRLEKANQRAASREAPELELESVHPEVNGHETAHQKQVRLALAARGG